MSRVVFDSSFLIAVAERPTTWREGIAEVLGGFVPVGLECVLAELNSIASSPGKRGKSAKVAVEISADFEREACRGGDVDSEIASYARSRGAAVASMDGELLRSLKASGVKCITLRHGRVAVY